jgi:protein-S-isoprenylcysteine O-methyltransferase Ste14
MSDQNNLLTTPPTDPSPPEQQVSPAPSGHTPVLISASPFDHPDYGREGEHPGHVIRSHPTWSLEETQRPWTGWASIATVLTGAILFAVFKSAPTLPEFLASILPVAFVNYANFVLSSLWEFRAVVLAASAFVAMAGVELLVVKVHRRHFDFSMPRALDAAAWKRVGARWLALLFCLSLAGMLYGCLAEYRFFKFPYPENGFFRHFRVFIVYAIAGLAVLSIPYFWMVERFARAGGPCDEFLVLARCLRRIWAGCWYPALKEDGRSALRNAHVKNLMLGLLVKFFYVPLMVTWTLDWSNWEQQSQSIISGWSAWSWDMPWDVALHLRAIHGSLLTLVIAAEVTTATVAYMVSVRILDTQVTSAEPTFFGWAIALICYPPFNSILDAFFWHNRWPDEMWHPDYYSRWPVASIASSLIGLALMSIYAYCTFCFGLRFSNLTNRGIISSGPYKYVRHPAYICKNLSWWILIIPAFIDYPVSALVYASRMAGISLVYFMRARSEEQHLMREPQYQEYCRKVPWRFIPGIW